MDTLMSMVRDLVIVAVIASFCDMLLPESAVRKPVQLIFSLYFMALLLNPVVSLWTETEFSDMDFYALGEAEVLAVEKEDISTDVYETAEISLAEEIETKLAALFDSCQFEVEIDMEEKGFHRVGVEVTTTGGINRQVMAAEIRSLLASDYGIKGSIAEIYFERS